MFGYQKKGSGQVANAKKKDKSITKKPFETEMRARVSFPDGLSCALTKIYALTETLASARFLHSMKAKRTVRLNEYFHVWFRSL